MYSIGIVYIPHFMSTVSDLFSEVIVHSWVDFFEGIIWLLGISSQSKKFWQVVPLHAVKSYKCSEDLAPLIPTLGTRWK